MLVRRLSAPPPWLHGLLHIPGLVGRDVLQGGRGHHQAARVVVVEDVVLADPPTYIMR